MMDSDQLLKCRVRNCDNEIYKVLEFRWSETEEVISIPVWVCQHHFKMIDEYNSSVPELKVIINK
jgi:hypothetical protein